MTRLAQLTSQALDTLAMVYFSEYHDNWARLSANDLG